MNLAEFYINNIYYDEIKAGDIILMEQNYCSSRFIAGNEYIVKGVENCNLKNSLSCRDCSTDGICLYINNIALCDAEYKQTNGLKFKKRCKLFDEFGKRR